MKIHQYKVTIKYTTFSKIVAFSTKKNKKKVITEFNRLYMMYTIVNRKNTYDVKYLGTVTAKKNN